ncbi:D-alanyl-D-alanine carboxypeptidase family protein [Alteribacter natronophilus]|uniref:D-alanyl-D-alanine carboxypeptidase family protein n=1 Tax=Alteribacter natronophilus TaxID=2583810 RepID=UPI00110DD512|nr:D-alanyl-D-alanine carboxypeptidase family protein [Alteribacter natronophilus]TMW73652.1 D-alanyl-D-alanine carboxypeptidase [Alteribacter natronophilus]
MKTLATAIFLIIFAWSTAFHPLPVNGEGYPGETSAQGAVLIELESGRVLYEKEAHTQMRIASITKIMTALLAIEEGNLEDIVTVSARAEGTEGSSLYLYAGEKLPLRDLVYGLMLRSGNDAAVAIAEHIGGSLEGFVYMMNEKAREIGMSGTVFNNPHGLDDHEEHYSTAYDMALLTKYAMENSAFREVSGTKSYRASERENGYRVFNNKNRLLTQLYPYSTGGKTGYTKRAKRTLVSTAAKDGLELAAVTLNAGSDWQDHMNMFNWAFDNLTITELVKEGKVKGIKDEVYKGRVFADYSFEYPLTEEEEGLVESRVTLLKPDPRWEDTGYPDPIGSIQVYLEEERIGAVPLSYVTERKDHRTFWQKMWDVFFTVTGVKTSG